MTNYLISIGEILFDANPKSGVLTLGGAPSNWAIDCHRLIAHEDLQTVVISGVGNDRLGQMVQAFLSNCKNKNGLPIKGLLAHVPDKETGIVMVSYDAQGEPHYDIVRDVAWDYIDFEKASPKVKSDIEHIKAHCCAVCWGTLAQRNPVSRHFIQQFVQSIAAPAALKIYDPNIREEIDPTTKEIIHQSLRLANTVKLSHDEVDKIGKAFGYYTPVNNEPDENNGKPKDYEERSRILFEKYPNINTLIITLSTRGSYIYTRKGECSFMEAEVVKDAKPVGCGDSFLAGVVSALVCGKDLKTAHELGNKVSAYVARHESATPELPDGLVISNCSR